MEPKTSKNSHDGKEVDASKFDNNIKKLAVSKTPFGPFLSAVNDVKNRWVLTEQRDVHIRASVGVVQPQYYDSTTWENSALSGTNWQFIMRPRIDYRIGRLDTLRLYIALLTYYLIALVPYLTGWFVSWLPITELMLLVHNGNAKRTNVGFDWTFQLKIKSKPELDRLIHNLVYGSIIHQLACICITLAFFIPTVIAIASCVIPSKEGIPYLIMGLTTFLLSIFTVLFFMSILLRGHFPAFTVSLLYPIFLIFWVIRTMWSSIHFLSMEILSINLGISEMATGSTD